MRLGFAAAEVQISETQTPLHRLETVYRRITESLRTASLPAQRVPARARLLVVHAAGRCGRGGPSLADADHAAVQAAAAALLDRRLEAVTRQTPAFAQALRGYDAAVARPDPATADALAAWLGGQPNVAAAARRSAGIRGDLDHFGAMGFLQGLLVVLRDCGHPGLVVVLDEVETLQRVRGDVRDKAFNALAAADRRDRLRSLPRAVPRDHRDAAVLRRTKRHFPAGPAGPAARDRLQHRSRGSTTPGPCRSACPASTGER